MLHAEMGKQLVRQLRQELHAHGVAMAIATHFDRHRLEEWGETFHRFCRRKGKDAKELVRFLTDQGYYFDMPGVSGMDSHFPSVEAAVKAFRVAEEGRFQALNALVASADELGQPVTKQWVAARIGKQRERVAALRRLEQLAASGLNPFLGEELLEEAD